MAARSKYNKALVERFYEYIRNGEKIYDACAKVDITNKTFNDWLKRKPEFKKGYEKANQEFRKSLPADLQYRARRSIVEILEHGLELTNTEVEIHSKPIAYDDNGKATKWKETFRIVRDRTNNVGIPQWVYDRVLPILPDLEQAKAIIEKHGYKIIPDPELETIENDIAQLKDQESGTNNTTKTLTTEEINYLKQAALFGDKEPPQHLVDVSAEVVTGE